LLDATGMPPDERREMKKQTVPTATKIEAELSRRVIGRKAAVKALARAAHEVLVRANSGGRARKEPAATVLLIGNGGTGKQFLLERLGEAAGLPLVSVAASHFEATGARELVAMELIERARTAGESDERPLEWNGAGIVHVLGLEQLTGNARARENLLRLLEGQRFQVVRSGVAMPVDSSRLLFVASAWPPGLEDVVSGRLQGGGSYFARRPRANSATADWREAIEERDLAACGFDRALLAAFPTRVALGPLERDQVLRLLEGCEDSPLAAIRQRFAAAGVELRVDRKALERVVERCKEGTDRLEHELQDALGDAFAQADELRGQGTIAVSLVRCGSLGLRVRRLRADREQPPTSRPPDASVRAAHPRRLPIRPTLATANVYGGEHWATEEDLAPLLTPGKGGVQLHGDVIVERGRNPASLHALSSRSVWLADEPRHPQRDLRRKNLLAVGRVGSGKTSKLILPLLRQDIADPTRSLVVIDAQGELTKFVYGWARKFRGPQAKVIYFNPKDRERSAGWNPLDGVRTLTDVRDFAGTLAAAYPVGERDTPYFQQQAKILLTHVLTALGKLTPRPALANVRELLQGGLGALKRVGEESNYRPLLSWLDQAQGNSNMGTSWSELDNLLECWSDEDVCACTMTTEFEFESLDREPTILVFASPEQYGRQKLAGLRALFIHAYFRFLMARGEGGDATELATIPLYVDEFASAVGRLDEFEVRCNTLRKRGLAIVAAVQYLDQIESVYGGSGAKSVLAAMGTKVFLPPLHDADATYASEHSGSMTVERLVANAAGGVAAVDLVRAPVMTPGDIRCIPAEPGFGERATISLPSMPWFQMNLEPWFSDPEDVAWFAGARTGEQPEGFAPPRRPAPLRYEADLPVVEIRPTRGVEPARDRADLTPEQVERLLKNTLAELDRGHVSGNARGWWADLRSVHADKLRGLLQFAEQVQLRRSNLEEVYRAAQASESTDAVAILHLLDYRRRIEKLALIEKQRGLRAKASTLDPVAAKPASPAVPGPSDSPRSPVLTLGSRDAQSGQEDERASDLPGTTTCPECCQLVPDGFLCVLCEKPLPTRRKT
jgi:type IV secretory pathway TraG/TraD family ATPase VirD4